VLLVIASSLYLIGAAAARANTAITVEGPVTYQISGSNVTLTVPLIDNATSGTTGTLRLELWAFAAPYNGQAETGYILGTYQLGTLSPNTEFVNVSETMTYTPPPNGSWDVTLFVSEYTAASGDNGYSPDAYFNFSTPLQVGVVTTAPSIATQPSNVTVQAGGSATFTVAASGSAPLSYQWDFNGSPISGATAAAYTISSAQSSNAGSYTCTVTNSAGSVTSSPATLTVGAAPSSTSRLINLSVRTNAGSGSQTLIAGFVIGGSGSKSVLLRGDGPSLLQFGVTGELPDPQLSLFNSSSTEIASNSKWGGSAALSNLFNEVGAFALPVGSNDAALYETLPAGAYTAQVSSTSGDTGVVLIEVYDADTGTPASRFVNLSARSEVGTGAQNLIAGFVIGGSGTETVLVRADGPALAAFGVSGVLAVPQLTLYDSGGDAIATDTGWGNATVRGTSSVQSSVSLATAATFSEVGAFALPANSADCAFVATLPAGAYTANVSGVNSTTGVALVEIYEIKSAGGGGNSAPVFTSEPSGQTITSGGSYTFDVSVSASATLQWYLNGVAIPGATGASFTATQAGTYTVVATNAYGSTTSSPASITVGSGGGGGSLTGTWTGTWTEDNAGGNFCSFQIWNITFTMTQTGSAVTGQFNMVVASTSADGDSGDLCPNSDGQVDPNNLVQGKPGELVQGTLSGSSFTIFTDTGIQFSGTLTGTTISGTGDAGSGSGFSVGNFTLTKQ
jgi:hypothetical protein